MIDKLMTEIEKMACEAPSLKPVWVDGQLIVAVPGHCYHEVFAVDDGKVSYRAVGSYGILPQYVRDELRPIHRLIGEVLFKFSEAKGENDYE